MKTKNYCYALVLTMGLTVSGHSNASADLDDRYSAQQVAHDSAKAEDYRAVDEAATKYLREKSRTESGLWKLTSLHSGVVSGLYSKTGDRVDRYELAEAAALAWTKKYPKSSVARIAYSKLLINHGWYFRGGDVADKVPLGAWAPFRAYIEKARVSLEANKAVASGDPEWYLTMMTIARAQSWDSDRVEALLNEAVAREPLYYQTYFEAFKYFLPKWGGSLEDVDAFANWGVKQTSISEGNAMYARIYWYASEVEFGRLFQDGRGNWPAMRTGFEDIVAKYPDPWNLNNYAKFACWAQDQPTARKLFKRIGPNIVAGAWPALEDQRRCQRWSVTDYGPPKTGYVRPLD